MINKISPPVICSGFVAVISLTILYGWQFNSIVLRRFFLLDAPQVMPLTALMLLILSVALFSSEMALTNPTVHFWKWICLILVFIVILVSLWVIAQYFYKLGPSLELLIFSQQIIEQGGRFPGRPSLHTAWSCLYIGLALALSFFQKTLTRRLSKMLAIAGAAIPWLILFGYIVAVGQLFSRSVHPLAEMSIQSAISLLALSLGTIMLQYSTGTTSLLISKSYGGMIVRRMLPIALIAPLIVGFLLRLTYNTKLLDITFRLAMSWYVSVVISVGLIFWIGFILQRKDEKQKKVEAIAHVGTWEMNLASKKVKWSDEIYRICGIEPGTIPITDEKINQFIHPDDRESNAQAIIMAAKLGKNYKTRNRVVRPDGSIRYVESIGEVVRDENKKPRRILGFFSDVTELKDAVEKAKVAEQLLAEEKLLQTNALQKAILDGADFTIISANTDGIIQTFNAGAIRKLYYTPDEVIGKVTPIIIHDKKEVERRAHELSKELGRVIEPGFEVFVAKARLGIPDENDWTYIRKDGSRFPVRLSVTALFDNNGHITGFMGVGKDITEQKQAEQALRESEERFRLIVEGVQDYAICMLSPAGQVISWNNGAQRIQGYTSEEIIGKHFSCFYQFETSINNRFSQALEIASKEGRFEEEEYRIKKDGSKFLANVVITPLFNKDNHLRGFTEITRDITKQKYYEKQIAEQQKKLEEANVQLQALSVTDALTGLKNRRGFEESLARELDRAKWRLAPLSLILFDVDRFKEYNDTYGHPAGDKALQCVAHILTSLTRSSDTIARYGGEEFVIILPKTNLKKALVLAERLRKAIENDISLEQMITASFGVSVWDSTTNSKNYETLVAQADKALYTAKHNGRNRVESYVPTNIELQSLQTAGDCVAQIKKALAQKEFELWLQPIVNLDDRRIEFQEVLLRLKKGNEIINPGGFLPTAARFHLMPQIDQYVVEKSIGILQEHPHINISINLSAQSLEDSEIQHFLFDKISDADCHRIIWEITETENITNIVDVAAFLIELRKKGFRVALDDFGSGFSSFGYLKHLPVDFIKIDGEIVKGLANNTIYYAFAKAITNMARHIGLKTIAEFVENESTCELLKEIGANFAQGYLFGRPVPSDQILSYSVTK